MGPIRKHPLSTLAAFFLAAAICLFGCVNNKKGAGGVATGSGVEGKWAHAILGYHFLPDGSGKTGELNGLPYDEALTSSTHPDGTKACYRVASPATLTNESEPDGTEVDCPYDGITAQVTTYLISAVTFFYTSGNQSTVTQSIPEKTCTIDSAVDNGGFWGSVLAKKPDNTRELTLYVNGDILPYQLANIPIGGGGIAEATVSTATHDYKTRYLTATTCDITKTSHTSAVPIWSFSGKHVSNF